MRPSTSTSPRHVLMTADTVGGVWTFAMDLCAELSREGIRVSLATMGEPPTSFQKSQAASIPNLDLYWSTFRLEWMDEPWDDVEAAGGWLMDLRRHTGAELVHLNGYVHAALPWTVPVIVVAHSCVLSWWRAVRHEDAPERYERYRHMVTRGIRSADLLVAPSAWMVEQIRANYGGVKNGVVIPNGRRIDYPPVDKQNLIFSCGRIWDEAKNIRGLCSVAPQLRWPLAVAGDSKDPDGRSVDLHNATLLGKLEQGAVAEWMAKAKIYALPAYYEPFGLSALEAALAGCALVLGRTGSLREIWGDAAIYVAAGKDRELIEAINGLIDNPIRLEELGRRARHRALALTPESMAEGYMDLYAAVCERYGRKMAGASGQS